MSRYDGLIIPRSYSDYINKTDAATLSQALQLPGVMDAAPTTGSIKPVQSGGVDNAIKSLFSLPTDAVLHYSFDDVPDYPDGTAQIKRLNGDTYSISVSSVGTISLDPYTEDGKIHKSDVNGNANYKTNTDNNTSLGMYLSFINYKGKLIIVDFIAKTTNLSIKLFYRQTSVDSRVITYPLGEQVALGRHRVCLYVPVECLEYSLTFYSNSATPNYTEWEFTGYYVGDGSYSTPIIDNANGQWNSVSQSGIAVQGLSGKGLNFPSSNQYVELPYRLPTSNDDFTISLWLNIPTTYEVDVDTIKGIIAVGSFYDLIGICRTNNSEILFIARTEKGTASKYVSMIKGSWHLYTMAYKGAAHTFDCYVDGVKQTVSGTNPANYQFGNNQKWRLWSNIVRQGSSASTVNQPATIDDVLFFNRTLSETEVMALYLNKANTPKYYGWADWKLQQPATATRNATIETPSEETQKEK